MNEKQYLAKRKELMDKAQGFIDEGKVEDANAKMKEVEKLDNDYAETTKLQANLNALNDSKKITDIEKLGQEIEGEVIETMVDKNESIDIYDSAEYRKAFMNNVLRGTSIPEKFANADANTKTSDVGSVIPTTIMEKIIEKMEATSMILPLVTRTSYKGGLAVPTSTVKPVATWVAEGAGSDKQKKATGSIVFAYHKLRCAVSVSLEVSVVTLGVFETNLIKNISEAMVRELEQSIITGTGTGQPKGILTETPEAGQAITGELNYATLVEAEGALPLAYENGAVWCMSKKTFMQFIGMVDSAGQPIARTNYGIAGRPERMLLGRTVVCNDYMPATGAVAFLFNFSDYILNTNYNITVKKYEDNDTDDQVTKAIMLVDGKVVDKNSLVTVSEASGE